MSPDVYRWSIGPSELSCATSLGQVRPLRYGHNLRVVWIWEVSVSLTDTAARLPSSWQRQPARQLQDVLGNHCHWGFQFFMGSFAFIPFNAVWRGPGLWKGTPRSFPFSWRRETGLSLWLNDRYLLWIVATRFPPQGYFVHQGINQNGSHLQFNRLGWVRLGLVPIIWNYLAFQVSGSEDRCSMVLTSNSTMVVPQPTWKGASVLKLTVQVHRWTVVHSA